MRKVTLELKWALLFALTTLAWMLGEKFAGLHSTHISQYEVYNHLFALPAITLYVLALLDKRRNFYGGSMTYLQGFISGLFVTLFVTILSPLTQLLTTEVISPEFFPNAIRYAVASGKMTQAEAEAYFNSSSFLQQALIGAPLMGIVTSAIVAVFTRRRKKDTRGGQVHVVYTEESRTNWS